MNLTNLRNFLVVASEGSITSAARRLHLSQPSLSRQIANLERELGTPLLTRNSHSVSLTRAGALLHRRATELIELAEKTEAEIGACAAEAGGDIYLGAAETSRISFLMEAAQRTSEAYPASRLRLLSGNAIDLLGALERGSIDFALVTADARLSGYRTLEMPWREAWVAYLPEGHPLSRREAIRPEDLAGERLIVSREGMRRNAGDTTIGSWLGPLSRSMHVAADFNLPFNAGEMARHGFGVLITWEGLIRADAGSGLASRPLEPPVENRLVLAWKAVATRTPAAQGFLEEIEAAVAREA